MSANAAMLLWYDIVPGEVDQHDDWHTREHFPERIGIPGFLSAQRWVAHAGTTPRCFVRYDVRDIGVLTSPAYAARLDNPSDWTRRMMPHFRGMVRGFCGIEHRVGSAMGCEMLTIRCDADAARRADLSQWLGRQCLPAIAHRRGFAGAWMLAAKVSPPMTAEQAIRGRDAGVDAVVLVSGYTADLLDDLMRNDLAPDALEAHGVMPGAVHGRYRFACRADAAD